MRQPAASEAALEADIITHRKKLKDKRKAKIKKNAQLIAIGATIGILSGTALGARIYSIITEHHAASTGAGSACPPEITPVTPPEDGTTSISSILRNPDNYVGKSIIVPDKTTENIGLNYKGEYTAPREKTLFIDIGMSETAKRQFYSITDNKAECAQTVYYAGKIQKYEPKVYGFQVTNISTTPPNTYSEHPLRGR